MKRTDIQKVIDDEVNPALEMHGGYVVIADYDGKSKSLKLKMGGGCHGCSSAQATLKMGIENLLRENFPELNEIEDITNHSLGENPYA